MHHDLNQGAIYRPHEDPDWDVTVKAADRIDGLEELVRTLVDLDISLWWDEPYEGWAEEHKYPPRVAIGTGACGCCMTDWTDNGKLREPYHWELDNKYEPLPDLEKLKAAYTLLRSICEPRATEGDTP
jgi:hypothetical protein